MSYKGDHAISHLPDPTPESLEAAADLTVIPYEALCQPPPPELAEIHDIECWERQERFLWAYAHLGTVLHAAHAVGIHPQTPERWQREDRYGFLARFERSHTYLCAGAENDVARILRERPHQHDILRIARLNRLDPEHWRRSDPPPPPNPEAQEALRGISALCAAILGARQQPAVHGEPGRTIEGQARRLPPSEGGLDTVEPNQPGE